MSVVRTKGQERAEAAWLAVKEVQPANAGKYLNLARSAPADIQVNGLGQTLAFWLARGEPEHQALYGQVSRWVGREMGAGGDLLEWLRAPGTGSDGYRRATVETIAFLVWVKRFAEAEFGGQEGRHG